MLDPIEAYIANLCDGIHTVDDIKAKTSEHFKLPRTKSGRYVVNTLARLARVLAITPIRNDILIYSSGPPRFNFKEPPRLSAPITVYWEVTYACDLRCPHCLTSSGKRSRDELSIEKAFTIVEQLSDAKVFALIITGGEPFLRPDIVEILRRLSDEKICVGIDTNGVTLKKRLIKELPSLGVHHIQVSIDGIGNQHDEFRGKKGAFDAACRTIRRLLEEGINVNILTTVTSRNVHDLDQLIDLALNLGCNGLIASPFIPAGRGKQHLDLKLSMREHYLMYMTVLKRAKELEGRIKLSTETDFLFLLDMPRSNKKNNVGHMGCSAGNDKLTIGADGTVYPCPFLHDFPLGNLLERPLKEIWNNDPVLETLRCLCKKEMSGACKSCRYAPEPCAGGCRARAYYESGDLKASDPACLLPLFKEKYIKP